MVFEGDSDALGLCSHNDTTIQIKSNLSDSRKEEVFVHELLHAVLFEAGYYEQDEGLVDRAAKVLHQVLKDNQLFKE